MLSNLLFEFSYDFDFKMGGYVAFIQNIPFILLW